MNDKKLSGFLLINKPKGIGSFWCVKRIRIVSGQKKLKVGHSGTLDRFATGLLVFAVDRSATRMISKVLELDKEYIVTAKLGERTDTLDHTGTIIETTSVPAVTKEALQHVITNLGKTYQQTPPFYSALKHKGIHLSKLAHLKKMSEKDLHDITAGKTKLVNLYDIEILDVSLPFFTLRAHVSHGTYIRALMNDIAQKLGTVATTYELKRTKIGRISVESAIDIDEFNMPEDIEKHIISIEEFTEKYLP